MWGSCFLRAPPEPHLLTVVLCFVIATATATSISNVIYTASSSGFTRVSFSFTPSASSTQLSMRLFPDRDNGTGTTIFFGAQLSNGQTVEKYIKTSGSTITELDRPQETLGNYIGIQNLTNHMSLRKLLN